MDSPYPLKGETQLEHFSRFAVMPPGALYLTLDDIFLLNTWPGDAQQTINITLRVLNPSGQIERSVYQFASEPVTDFSPNQHFIPGMEGFLLSLTVQNGSSNVNTCFVSCLLQKGQGTSDIALGNLLVAGYCSQYDTLGFPQSVPARTMDGRGGGRLTNIANPAAGVDFTTTIANGLMWKIGSISAKFTASAAVANRFPCLQFSDFLNKLYFTVPPVAAITASQTVQCCWYPGANLANLNNIQTMAIPIDARVSASLRVRVVTTGLDAGDAWTDIKLLLEQWIGI